MATTDRAICLRTTDFSETSQVLVMLTRDSGVVKLLAKGSKRPKSKSGGRIDLFSEGECTYAPAKSKDLSTLMEFTETAGHVDLRSDLDRLNAGMMMLELAGSMLAEGDPQPVAFDLLHNALPVRAAGRRSAREAYTSPAPPEGCCAGNARPARKRISPSAATPWPGWRSWRPPRRGRGPPSRPDRPPRPSRC